LEVHRLEGTKYRRLKADNRGHYFIEPLGVKLGVWNGFFWNETAPWLRWYDKHGNLLPIGDERANEEYRRAEAAIRKAEQERDRAEQERNRADNQQRRADQLAAKLRELGIDPTAIEPGPIPGE
jgi:hypothetical protein